METGKPCDSVVDQLVTKEWKLPFDRTLKKDDSVFAQWPSALVNFGGLMIKRTTMF